MWKRNATDADVGKIAAQDSKAVTADSDGNFFFWLAVDLYSWLY
jgi:hypothetical protein